MYNFGVVADLSSGLREGQVSAYVSVFLNNKNRNKINLEVLSPESDIHTSGDKSYLRISPVSFMEYRTLIEFNQETSDGRWRAWIDNKDLVGLLN